MKYNLCVSIPIKYTSVKEVKPILDKATKLKPDFIELRFDYISNIEKLSPDFIRDLFTIIHPHAAVILTLRSSSEGVALKLNQSERFKILKIFIEAKPDYLDIEMNTDKNTLNEIINLSSQNEIKIIFSYHNFKKTLTFEESITLLQDFNQKIIQRLSIGSRDLEEVIYKIIFTAQSFEDNLVALQLCKEFSNSNQKIISFCMGELGLFSRIMCIFTGSFLTYASLEEKTAPGQINLIKMREIYDLLFQ